MKFEKAKTIRQELLDSWNSIKIQLAENPETFGFSGVEFLREKPKEEALEGPAVRYPEVSVSFKGIKGQARTSITVCVSPRHSKIWFRLSFLGGNGSTQSSNQLNQAAVEHFFNYADDTAEKAVRIYIDTYGKILQCWTGKTLLSAHIIRVRTIPANLMSVATLLKSGTFRVTDYFDTLKQLRPLRGLLNLTYGRDVSSRDEYECLAKDYRWIAVNIREDNDIVGLYSVHHYDGRTDFTGLVHGVSGDPHELSLTAQKFSRELINDIAPKI